MPEVEPSTDYLCDLSNSRISEDLADALALLRGYAVKTVLLRSASFFIDFGLDQLRLRLAYSQDTGTARLLKTDSPSSKLVEVHAWILGLPSRGVLDFQVLELGGTPPDSPASQATVPEPNQVTFTGRNARDRWDR